MPTRILITGDRHWLCLSIARRTLASIRAKLGTDFIIVHGDATGVDRAFRLVCEEMGIEHEPHPADWDAVDDGGEVHHWTGRSYDPSAGPRRNAEMIALGAAYAIAVHRSLARSKGTKDCARRCLAAGIKTYLIDGVNPTRRVTGEDLKP